MRTTPICRAPFSQVSAQGHPPTLATHTPTVSVCHSPLPCGAPGALSHCREPPGTPDLHEGEGRLALPQGRPGTSQALRSAQSCRPRASEPWETPPCGLQPPSNLWASRWALLHPHLAWRQACRGRACASPQARWEAGLCEEGHLDGNSRCKGPEAGAHRGGRGVLGAGLRGHVGERGRE